MPLCCLFERCDTMSYLRGILRECDTMSYLRGVLRECDIVSYLRRVLRGVRHHVVLALVSNPKGIR